MRKSQEIRKYHSFCNELAVFPDRRDARWNRIIYRVKNVGWCRQRTLPFLVKFNNARTRRTCSPQSRTFGGDGNLEHLWCPVQLFCSELWWKQIVIYQVRGDSQASSAATDVDVDSRLSEHVLREHFHLPLSDVAKKFGMCTTAFKKHCRRQGVVQWPQRTLKSLEKKIASLHAEQKFATDQHHIEVEIRKLEARRIAILSGNGSTNLDIKGTQSPSEDGSTKWVIFCASFFATTMNTEPSVTLSACLNDYLNIWIFRHLYFLLFTSLSTP